jgi:O-antigen/teichoic acid export membrane protein
MIVRTAEDKSLATAVQPTTRSARFFRNVLWNWLGVAVNLFIAVFLSPYIVRRLGDVGYGVWVLVLGLIEYYWLLDLGFRSATLKYSAEYSAGGESGKINTILNTALAYSTLAATFMLATTVIFSTRLLSLFPEIPAAYRPIFPVLINIVGVGWALGIVFNMFNAALEGFQRFDIVNRIWIVTNGLRAIACVVLLASGYGLIEMGIAVVSTQVLGYMAAFIMLRRVFPAFHLSPALVRLTTLRQILRYGVHTFLATVADRALNQGPPVLIGHFKPTAFVGYFAMPTKLMQYTSDLVSRAASVTGSSASAMSAQGDMRPILSLATFINRYCLAMFLPMALFFLIYGRELIGIWFNTTFADRSTPLLLPLVLSTGIAMAAQYNSSAILFGLAKHAWYARALALEAMLNIALLLVVIPRYGIVGAAWSCSLLMILNRGLFTPWLLTRYLASGLTGYMLGIYTRPLLTAIPVAIALWGLKHSLVPGQNWWQLAIAAAVSAGLYYALAFFSCFEAKHRAAAVEWMGARLAKRPQTVLG